ncbi:MAG: energy transducer TonB [Terracidiphilus sp.]|nr:energy transducer TonB [Terracidiphilus sp.]
MPASQLPGEIQISRNIAEKLLLHKEEIVCKQHGMSARITGTVVVVIEISRTGKISFAKAISGPAMLIPPALKAVRKYQYGPTPSTTNLSLSKRPLQFHSSVRISNSLPFRISRRYDSLNPPGMNR